MRGLCRARGPDGRPRWLWRPAPGDGDPAPLDLSAAGWGEDLAAPARWLLGLDPAAAAGGGGDVRPGPGDPLLEGAPRAAWAGAAERPAGPDTTPLLLPGRPGKALALGKNFAAHAREFGGQPPEELIWFAKLPEVLIGPGEAVRIPSWLESRVDPEAEIVALIGAPLHGAGEEQAQAAVAGYTLGNDVTARKQQGEDRKRGWPWLRCKNLATFGPLGPCWVPAAALPDLGSRHLRGYVNGGLRQEARLGDWLWSPGRALAEISRWCPLVPGDLVFLGTPAGVAPIQAGDLLAVEVEGLGRLENPVVRDRAPAGG